MIDQIAELGTGVGVLIAAVFAGYQSVQAKREARKAKDAAHPVSNGWGTAVRADLSMLVTTVTNMERRQATADERQNIAERRQVELAAQVSEATDYARTGAEQASAVAAGLSAHLADHARANLTPDYEVIE